MEQGRRNQGPGGRQSSAATATSPVAAAAPLPNGRPVPTSTPPFDSEYGLTLINAQWLVKAMGFKETSSSPPPACQPLAKWWAWPPRLSATACAVPAWLSIPPATWKAGTAGAARTPTTTPGAPASGRCPGATTAATISSTSFPTTSTCLKYGGEHDDLAPFVINQHKNGMLTPWGFNYNHGIEPISVEDYKTSRYILNPLRNLGLRPARQCLGGLPVHHPPNGRGT